MMVRKSIVIYLTLVMILSTINFSPVPVFVESVKANPFEESKNVIGLDHKIIFNITQNLSNLIYDAYTDNELAKGRYYGSKGDIEAARIIYENFTNWGIESEKDLIDTTPGIYSLFYPGFINHTLKLNSMDLSFYNHSNTTNPEITIEDFYISPRWNLSILLDPFSNYFSDKLSYEFNESGLDIFPRPMEISPYIDNMLTKHLTNITNSSTILDGGGLFTNLSELLESEYGFNFSDLEDDPENATTPWHNETLYSSINGDFVFIHENPGFNPDREDPTWWNDIDNVTFNWKFFKNHPLKHVVNFILIKLAKNYLTKYKSMIEMRIWLTEYQTDSGGCKGIIHYDHQDDVYDMNLNLRYPLPVIYINKSLGEAIVNDLDNYTANYTLNQTWEKDVISYNVIGKIEGYNTDETIILSNLLDGWFNQGTADAAIGTGIIMAIANYTREMEKRGIKPKCNLKFILFSGEEAGLRGTFSYEKEYRWEDGKRVTVIDLNQLGFNQQDPRMTLYAILNKIHFKPGGGFYIGPWRNNTIKNSTISIIGDNSNFKERTDEYTNFSTTMDWTPLSDYLPFMYRQMFIPGQAVRTICFLQEHDKKPYSRWMNHHRTGLEHQEGDSMDIYNESFVNITAELIYNVTRYYAYNPDTWFKTISHTVGDSPNDDDNLVDYVNVTFEIDTIMSHDRVAVQAILWTSRYPLFKEREMKYYTLTDDGTTGYINISVGPNEALGLYNITVLLFNSTGDLHNEIFNKALTPWGSDYYSSLFANDSYSQTGFKIFTPYSTPTITTPSFQSSVSSAGTACTYTAGANDTEGDKIFYQWEFKNNDTNYVEYTPWMGPYNSDVNSSVNYTWSEKGNITVRARVRDDNFVSTHFSNWTQPFTDEISAGVNFTTLDKVLINETFNVTGATFNFTAINWSYTFIQSRGAERYEQNPQYNYSSNNTYTIKLRANDSENNYYYFNKSIQVLHTIADMNTNTTFVQPNENITFSDNSRSINTITNWTWDFGDQTNSYVENPTHSYSLPGKYNVTLTTTDDESLDDTTTEYIYVDPYDTKLIYHSFAPTTTPLEKVYTAPIFYQLGRGQNISFYIDCYDNISGISQAYINITYPDGTNTNQSMEQNTSSPVGFQINFNDTTQVGYYLITFWIIDNAGNVKSTSEYIEVQHLFGHTNTGEYNTTLEDIIKGTKFTAPEDGNAESIEVLIRYNETEPFGTPAKVKCMIYQGNNLLGTTEEKNITTREEPEMMQFKFIGTQPEITANTDYYLYCWSDLECNISFDNYTEPLSYQKTATYGTPPNPITIIIPDPPENENLRKYSIFCRYSNLPIISDIIATPDPVGFGYNVTISANITDSSGIDHVSITITYPTNEAITNYTMENSENDTHTFVFEDCWWNGQYNYTIYATDLYGNINSSDTYTFNVSSNASISICTIYDNYEDPAPINLTDPPAPNPEVNWELMDNEETLRFWNKYDNYYINTASGIQLTNHKDDYWTHNVLMLGYYQNGEWKKLYRTDELTGFTMDIDDDDSTYLNVTFWKNVMANGYPLRLAIRYHLGGDDNDLTVIPYVKSRAGAVPYQLAFGWELKDIQINMTTTDDYIEINGTSYDLDTALNISYTNLSRSIEWFNETTNQTEIIGWEPRPYLYIREDIPNEKSLYLYLKWKESLNYKVRVKSRDGQTNAPVTLFIKVGTLATGQEKSTELKWYDAEEATYYFDTWDETEEWATNPSYMVDGNEENYASTNSDEDVELCNDNSYSSGGQGTISKVEIRCKGYDTGNTQIYLQPVFGGTEYGEQQQFTPGSGDSWSSWFDITRSEGAPEPWTWSDIADLDCDVKADIPSSFPPPVAYCSKVELRVTYTVNYAPTVSNPIPASGSNGVVYVPWLSVNVSDANDDNMNVIWLTNYSGNWTTFGSNTSVGTGKVMQNYINATENGKLFYWKVNVTDGTNYTVSPIYSFYTGYQSKIKNTGNTNIRGYLTITLQRYNSTSSKWKDIRIFINDIVPRSLNYTGQDTELGFDSLCNGQINTSNLEYYGNSTYRFYASFKDPYDDPLIINDQPLEATYEFDVIY